MASTPPSPTTPSGPQPVILVAAPRSGASVLQQALAAHPAIAFAPPFDFLVEAITPDGRFLKREAFIRAMEIHTGFKRLGLAIPPGQNFFGIAQDLLMQVAAAKPGAAVAGFTLQHAADRALWLWPDARFIHLVRDGRDVAVAEVESGWSGTLWHGIEPWADLETLWERMSHKLPPDRQISIRYELLASEGEHELRRLTDFLGLPFDPAMLAPLGQIRLPAPGANRWRRAATAEISAAEHRAARWLLQGGYFLSGTVRPPSLLRRFIFNTRHRMAASRRRRELLGTGLWFKSWLIGKIGRKKAKAKLARQQAQYLGRETDWT